MLSCAFLKAISDYHRMQSAQVAALRNGDGFLFDAEIIAARKQVDAVRRLIAKHEQSHGC